jgi:hypothetical protein
MARLGYTAYGAQGGDWGRIISTQVALPIRAARRRPSHQHVHAGAPGGSDPNAGLTDAEIARLKVRQAFQAEETGYQQIQGTKPQTIGIALNDSPAGLAAWIVEKFRTWCDCDGNPESVLTKRRAADQHHAVLGHADRASSRSHLLRERHRRSATPRRIETPTACADFPKEIIWSPRRWLEPRYNITRWTVMPRGGTSPRSSSRSCWWTTSARSFGRCAKAHSHSVARLQAGSQP